MQKIKTPLVLFGGGFLFIIDRFLKYQTLHKWNADKLINHYFGWHPLLNLGVAFGLPMPEIAVIILSTIIILLVGFLFIQSIMHNHNKKPMRQARGEHEAQTDYLLPVMSYAFIFFGAISNLIDRIIYGYTVDYLLILTGVFNLADALIIAGFVLFFVKSKKQGE